MEQPAPPQPGMWVQIFSSHDARVVAELALVLESRSIASVAQRIGNESRLIVQEHDAPAAIGELRQYEQENARSHGGARAIEYLGRGWPGVFLYVSALLIVAICVEQDALSIDWLRAGRLVAGDVTAGEWWRTITALTLHVDYVHLFGNIIFGSFFGYFVSRYVGAGVGWSAIILAGGAGNFVNALVQAADHRAIGASTAVFAALGILTAYTWRKGFLRHTPWRMRFAPITAGIALLAFTGAGGENTDLGAHLFGFLCGVGTGIWLARSDLLRNERVQVSCVAVAAALPLIAWIRAAVSGG